MMLRWPLMRDNVPRQDRLAASNFFLEGGNEDLSDTKLTQGPQVAAFEREFADWLGVKYAVMVNSGASANLITMHALKELHGAGEVIVPTITWSSDIASVLHAGLTPVFVEVDPHTLGIDWNKANTSHHPLVAFPTHVLGFNALPPAIRTDIFLIEDCCESIGATQDGRKLGTFGLASNFSFYYGHHMTTIEGGMVCTNDEAMYEICRMLRSHGMTREIADAGARKAHEDVLTHPEFTFYHAGFNVRSTEVNAVIGRSQLKRLDANNAKRTENLLLFLSLLDPTKYRAKYRTEGSSNFALPLVLTEPDAELMARVLKCLQGQGVEYRRGTAGGGNQLRQPYLRHIYGDHYKEFPQAEHVHQYGLYVGNYPSLEHATIAEVCEKLSAL